jgi:hypothetical protein
MIRGSLVVLFALALFIPLAVLLGRDGPTINSERARALFAVPHECRPEPGERRAYLAGLCLLPPLIFAGARLTRRLSFSWPDNYLWIEALISGGLVVATLAGVALATYGDKDDQGHGWYHLRHNFFIEHPLALIAVPLITCMLMFSRRFPGRKRWLWASVGVCLLLPLSSSVFSDQWFYAGRWHFNAVFDSAVRVHMGRALLVDSTCQYGLYAWFLEPLFRIIGLSVAKFTLVMGLLTALSYAFIGLFLHRAIRDPLLAAIGFAATLFGGWALFLTVEGPHRGSYLELYFQYVPIRLLFPALLLGLANCWLLKQSRWLGWLIWVVLGMGVLWNVDAGLPALATWLITLVYFETQAGRSHGLVRRMLAHCLAAATAGVGVVVFHALSTRFGARYWPDYTLMIRSQLIFYEHGFGMLPLPWPGAWMAVIAVYSIGLAYAALQHDNALALPRARAVFMLSILGLLLFSYYQGRSHRAVLILAWWPVFPLLTLLLDGLLESVAESRWRRLRLGLGGCPLVFVLLGFAGGLLERMPMIGDYAGRQLGALLYGGPAPLAEETQVLRTFPPRGAKVWIISERESILQLTSNRQPVSPAGFNQLLLMCDYERMAQVLAVQPATCLWIDRAFLEAALPEHQGLQVIADLLAVEYEPVAVTNRGWLFRRRQGFVDGPPDAGTTILVRAHRPAER